MTVIKAFIQKPIFIFPKSQRCPRTLDLSSLWDMSCQLPAVMDDVP
ncbi:MAG: hypothetical protein KJ069_30835 [Anaerolineae bacterium]|nr:hypothetical protein [Anaerolineae bacterium]